MNSDRREFIKTFVLGIVSTGPVFSLLSCENDKENKKTKKPETETVKDYSKGIELRKGYMVLEPEVQKTFVALAATVLPGTKDINNFLDIFMEKMSGDHGEAGFFDAGLWNVNTASNMQTGKPFHELEKEEEKENVIKLVRQTNRQFFNRFRNEIIKMYYTHPVSWRKLSYNGPPQPEGFMDYYKAPQHS